MCPGSLSEDVEPGAVSGLEFLSKTRNGVFIFVQSFHQKDLHPNVQAVLCVIAALVQDPLCSLRCGLLPACLSAALVLAIWLSGLAGSCVISEPLSRELVGPLSQTENTKP